MQLQNLSISNLYGKNYNIPFFEELTILYGLNGSGKTTILNIIFHISQGDFKKVCAYKFDQLEVSFFSKKKHRSLMIIKGRDSYKIILDDIEFEYIPEDLSPYIEYDAIDENEEQRYMINEYGEKIHWVKSISSQKQVSHKLIEEIKSDVEAVYIPLNRKVKGLEKNIVPKNGIVKSNWRSGSNKENIEDSLGLAERYFESYMNRITIIENHIHNTLNKEILKYLSKPINNISRLLYIKEQDFSLLERVMGDFVDENVYANLKALIKIYKETLDSYQIDSNGEISISDAYKFLEHNYVLAQLNNFKEVSEVANKRKKRIDEYKDNIENVIVAINKLFIQTDKKMGIKKREFSLYFQNFHDKNELDLTHLSSGEQQIVIFFIFSLIDYDRKASKLLLVDEPELSLHIEWQSQLLPLIFEYNKKNQMIIATHSPDVIGEYENRCVEVRGVINA